MRFSWATFGFCAALAGGGLNAAQLPRPGEAVNVEAILASMSLEEKVGQLIMIGFPGTKSSSYSQLWVKERQVGGVALFSRNIANFEQIARFTRDLQKMTADHIPIFLALDQEGGNVVRVKDGAMVLPGNMAMGATRSTALSYVAGQGLAVDLRMLGFNMNLAPVLDVNSNPKNPVIGVRSYGEKADLVGDLGSWYVRGQQEMGVVAVAKHFPGHGDTVSDSHFAMPTIPADLSRLDSMELMPFREAINAGLDAIMTAHIALPKVAESAETPATLSRILLTDILRKRLGFNGIIITDGLEMQGIVQRYGAGRAAVLAILAGADMPMVLWMPNLREEVYTSLLSAAQSGEISPARLNESVRRILSIKAKRGFFERKVEPLESILALKAGNRLHSQVAMRVAREAVTLVRNHGDVLPLRKVRYRNVLVLAPPGAFADRMARESNVTILPVSSVPTREERGQDIVRGIDLANNADILVVAAVNRYHIDVARNIMRSVPHIPVALLSFASPYYLTSMPDVEAYVCTYSYQDSAQLAAAEALLGLSPMPGRLPITIPGFYAYGHRYEDNRMASIPEATASVR